MNRLGDANEAQILRTFDITFKRRALRDAVICIAWMKFMSIVCYAIMFVTIHYQSSGKMSMVLKIMVIVLIPFQMINGILLFLGALERKIFALDLSLWLCLVLATYTTVVGVVGCIYFIRTGNVTLHFVLALIFALLAFSMLNVICHDILIVYAYKQILLTPTLLDPPEPRHNNVSVPRILESVKH